MKKLITLSFFLAIVHTSFGQYFVEKELDKMALEIKTVIENANNNTKNKIKVNTVLVENFTNTEGRVSKLGANLAEELSMALVYAGGSFMISERDLIAGVDVENNKIDRIGDAIEKGGVGLEKNSDEYQRKEEKAAGVDDLFDSVDMITQLFNKRSTKYKGIDAIIIGTLTESNDHYRINVKVISADKNHKLLGGTRGNLAKTPFMTNLEAEELKRQEKIMNKGARTTPSNDEYEETSLRRNSKSVVFKQGNLEFNLIGCEQMGQNIECVYEIENNGVDYIIGIYRNHTVAYEAKNGNEYKVGNLTLGDKSTSGGAVQKMLIKNVPLRSTITFIGVGEEVDQLAKVNLRYYYINDYHNAEFRDVRVQ